MEVKPLVSIENIIMCIGASCDAEDSSRLDALYGKMPFMT